MIYENEFRQTSAAYRQAKLGALRTRLREALNSARCAMRQRHGCRRAHTDAIHFIGAAKRIKRQIKEVE